jgi:TonB family protein
LIDFLLKQILHPMPDASEIDRFAPLMNKLKLGDMSLDCIMLAGQLGGDAQIPTGLFPTYCLTDTNSILRAAIHDIGEQVVLRNSIALFQGRYVAHDVVVQSGKLQVAEAKILSLEQRNITNVDLSTDGLPATTQGSQGGDGLTRVSSGVISGFALHRVPPLYPAAAKARHAEGTVSLHAIIGKDGQMHDLQVVSSPDPDLALAAIDAVRQWKYKAYTLAGSPVAVDTTVNVNFTLGR